MRNWRSLFEILRFPLELILIAMVMMGIGNTITNPYWGINLFFENDLFELVGQLFLQAGRFMVVNFPIVLMIKICARRGGAGTTFVSSFAGYVAFLITTAIFATDSLGINAYSSTLGISVNGSVVNGLTNGSHYPLQTGVIGILLVVIITLISFNQAKKRNEYGIFGFISWEASCTIRTVFFSIVAGLAMSFLWPYVILGIQKIVSFISVDTSNPINLTLYGIMDGLLNTLGLGSLIRQPFWYGINGGTWVNLAGTSIAGDVNIWTNQLAASSVMSTAGKFITPYYVLNIFAVPGMVWAMFSLYTDPIEKRRKRLLAVIVTIVSILSGSLLPLEIMLLVLCPLLFLFHLGFSGILFGLLQALHCYVGYQTTTSYTTSALPGTLPELITYIGNPSLNQSLMILIIVGAASMLIYFFVTRLYFKHMAIDLFNTGDLQRVVEGTIKAVGGTENIKMTQSSMYQLTIQVFDPEKINVDKLKRLGSYRVYETRHGFRICYGASSTMVKIGISKMMRESIRVDESK